jgi:hypothetical protein
MKGLRSTGGCAKPKVTCGELVLKLHQWADTLQGWSRSGCLSKDWGNVLQSIYDH